MSHGSDAVEDRFEVDTDGRRVVDRLPVRLRTVALAGVLTVLAVAGVWEEVVTPDGVVPFWGVSTSIIEYLYYASLAVAACYVGVPLARRPDLRRRYWRRLRRRPVGLAAAAYLLVVWYAATFGAWTIDALGVESTEEITYGVPPSQPPAWATVEMSPTIPYCQGTLEGDLCHGTWYFPLGTTVNGDGLVTLIVEGGRASPCRCRSSPPR
ncbi:hypothetical protein [Halobaculum litoreum]|uniref:hypothetical protein n=1 Tax=Halobaculum litoreum TaxID=3031998 RepID=UPI0024C3D3E3|nr:hypothetical protein [Halobaculum sp. DT92]